MITRRFAFVAALACITVSNMPSPSHAQVVGGMLQGGSGERIDPTQPIIIELSVTPASVPGRSSGVLLRPASQDILFENAAPYYYQALQMLGQLTPEEAEEISDRRDSTDLLAHRERVESLITKHLQDSFALLQLAARCERCDWQTPIHHFGATTMMPELGRLRAVTRTLALKARLETSRHQYTDALTTIRTGIALARHCSEGPTLLQSLVGYAIMNVMHWELDQLIRSPDAPSLYWALTSLGTPVFDIQHAIDAEYSAISYTFPEIFDIDSGKAPPAQAIAAWKAFTTKFNSFTSNQTVAGSPELAATLNAVSDTIQVYPAARDFFLSRGISTAQIDAWPISYVSLRYLIAKHLDWHDIMFRWASLPYWLAIPGLVAADERHQSEPALNRLEPLQSFMPSFGNNLRAHIACERRTAMLRCVEAIRLYAHANKGQLPRTLDDTASIAPCPLDPATGKPFDYRVESGVAIISGWTHPSAMRSLGYQYVVRMSPASPK